MKKDITPFSFAILYLKQLFQIAACLFQISRKFFSSFSGGIATQLQFLLHLQLFIANNCLPPDFVSAIELIHITFVKET